MDNNQERAIKYLNRAVTRRQAIKAGGIAAVGLAFSKPLIETLYPKPAFANYAVGRPSIEWAVDDIDTGSLSLMPSLCNVSNAIPVTINQWEMRRVILLGAVTSVTVNGVALGDALVSVPVGSLTSPPDPTCTLVNVVIAGTGSPIKIQIWVRGIDTNGQATDERRLTITVE